MTEATAAAFN